MWEMYTLANYSAALNAQRYQSMKVDASWRYVSWRSSSQYIASYPIMMATLSGQWKVP